MRPFFRVRKFLDEVTSSESYGASEIITAPGTGIKRSFERFDLLDKIWEIYTSEIIVSAGGHAIKDTEDPFPHFLSFGGRNLNINKDK